MWVDNQGIRTKLFDKEILFEFANLVGINVPPKIIGTQLIHNLIKKDILSISLTFQNFKLIF